MRDDAAAGHDARPASGEGPVVGSIVRRALIFVVLATLAAACGSTPKIQSSPGLPTMDVIGQACGGVGLTDATLHGSSTDRRVAWLEIAGFPDRAVVFPTGFTARFAPALEVLDTTGAVAFREGSSIVGACVAPDDALLIGWP
jgi:hypothetical protein